MHKHKHNTVMVLETVARSNWRKWSKWDIYARTFKAGSISLTLGFASIFCWQHDLPELAVGAGLSSASVYLAALTDERLKNAHGRYVAEKESASLRSLDSLTELCEQALERIEVSEPESCGEWSELDETYRKHKHPAVLYVKNKFITAEKAHDKDAYLWILLRLNNYQLMANPTELTYDDRFEAIEFLRRYLVFSSKEASTAFNWAIELKNASTSQIDTNNVCLEMMSAALTASSSDLVRQEAIFRIAILAGISLPAKSYPPSLEIDDCLEVIDWLKQEHLLTLAQKQELENWAYSERELA
jgi:hypothetical protein